MTSDDQSRPVTTSGPADAARRTGELPRYPDPADPTAGTAHRTGDPRAAATAATPAFSDTSAGHADTENRSVLGRAMDKAGEKLASVRGHSTDDDPDARRATGSADRDGDGRPDATERHAATGAATAGSVKSDPSKADGMRPDLTRTDAAAHPGTAGPDGVKSDGMRSDAVRTDAAKADIAKSDATKADADRSDAVKSDAATADHARAGAVHTDASKAHDTKAHDTKAHDTKADAARTDAMKSDAVKSDAAKADALRTDTTTTDAARSDAVRTDAAKTDAAKTDAVKTDAMKSDAMKADVPKVAAARATTPHSGQDARKPLFGDGEVESFRSRWKELQIGFVDEPRESVQNADALVNDVMRALTERFAAGKKDLEGRWRQGEPQTEELRLALQGYRSFFDQLLRT